MALEIIGAGLSRTGTFSLKLALEKLGIGKCYHMHDVFMNDNHVKQWQSILESKPPKWEQLFAGYSAAVDAPSWYYWRELTTLYPESKIILTVRDSDEWYRSMAKTIYEVIQKPGKVSLTRDKLFGTIFGGEFENEEMAKRIYDEHNDEVRSIIHPERLLVFRVADGWAPLCHFLGLPIPDEPFPNTNTMSIFSKQNGLH